MEEKLTLREYRTYSYELRPTGPQKALLARLFGTARFIHNHSVEYRLKTDELVRIHGGGHLNRRKAFRKMVGLLMDKHEWLKEFPEEFYFGITDQVRRSDRPRYRMKKKQNVRNRSVSGRYPDANKFTGKRAMPRIPIPKKKFKVVHTTHFTGAKKGLVLFNSDDPIKIIWTREFPPRIKVSNFEAWISRSMTGKYFVHFVTGRKFSNTKSQKDIGLDFGIRTFLTDHAGNKIKGIDKQEKILKKIRREYERLQRMQVGSNNWKKQRLVLSKALEKLRNKKKNEFHQITTSLVKNHKLIGTETLKFSSMAAIPVITKGLQDLSPDKFFYILDYKARDTFGCEVVRVPSYFPSTQKCSSCGFVRGGKNRVQPHWHTWRCPECRAHHDRDVNAARNILIEARKQVGEFW